MEAIPWSDQGAPPRGSETVLTPSSQQEERLSQLEEGGPAARFGRSACCPSYGPPGPGSGAGHPQRTRRQPERNRQGARRVGRPRQLPHQSAEGVRMHRAGRHRSAARRDGALLPGHRPRLPQLRRMGNAAGFASARAERERDRDVFNDISAALLGAPSTSARSPPELDADARRRAGLGGAPGRPRRDAREGLRDPERERRTPASPRTRRESRVSVAMLGFEAPSSEAHKAAPSKEKD